MTMSASQKPLRFTSGIIIIIDSGEVVLPGTDGVSGIAAECSIK